jgi:precorrin-4 methylase
VCYAAAVVGGTVVHAVISTAAAVAAEVHVDVISDDVIITRRGKCELPLHTAALRSAVGSYSRLVQ